MNKQDFKIGDILYTEFCCKLIKVEVYGVKQLYNNTDELIYSVRGKEEHNHYFDEELMERFLFKTKEEAIDLLIQRQKELNKLIESIK